jgi:hypothetical protein
MNFCKEGLMIILVCLQKIIFYVRDDLIDLIC